jgi:redox-regulated HSP33 family molecular chaperone
MYFLSTSRICDEAEELYEKLHELNGDAKIDKDKVLDSVKRFKSSVAIETDLIKEALNEYLETQGQARV